MITLNTIEEIKVTHFKEGDLVRVIGSVSEGDIQPVTGKARRVGFITDNQLVKAANEIEVEIFPNGALQGLKELVMQSPNGNQFMVSVSDSGTLMITLI